KALERKAQEQLTESVKTKAKLREYESELKVSHGMVDNLKKGLSEKNVQLQEAYARQQVMEEHLALQAQEWTSLSQSIQNVFKDLNDNSVTIKPDNGRLLISLNEKLLFASGSTIINQSGKQKLAELAEALSDHNDLTFTVEGHTDNVPVMPNELYKDNVELSVLRARSVFKILSTKIAPSQLVVAGRGEYSPIAPNDSDQGKAQNRRTEIIVTPNEDFNEIIGKMLLAPAPSPTQAKLVTTPENVEKYLINMFDWKLYYFDKYTGLDLVKRIRTLNASIKPWKINTGNNFFTTQARPHKAIVVYSDNKPSIQDWNLDKDMNVNLLTIAKD
ncbi:MAG TPA: OmpA family protein, partial [Sphingobacteriaceae bacterium]